MLRLKAQWAVFAKDKRLLLNKEAEIKEEMNGSSYESLVAAMSSALERLSQEIADGIRSVFQKEQTGR
jgi:uncharacterized lipoprotein YmbA